MRHDGLAANSIPHFSLLSRYRRYFMVVSYAAEAARVRELGGLSEADIARATGVAPSTARAWLAGTRAPTGERAERLIELAAMVERLARVVRRDYIPIWLRKPIPLLDDDKPLDIIAAGQYRRLSEVIAGLEDPGAS
jgi:transcriptional regulator with XRE-family HTH domain